ncbi:hypothetical protein KKA33_00265 [Patescibacteria group bacterium]|nr:hypothetical protein [Patescibacteria group bacterium]
MQTLDDLDKEGKVTPAKTGAKGPDFTVLEAKLDQILKYQKTARALAIFRGIISFVFFLIFIVLPIVGGVYFFKYIRESGAIEQLIGQYREFYETVGNLKDTAGQVGNLGDILDGVTK